MKKLLLLLFVLLNITDLSLTAANGYYFLVQFKNKNNTAYSLANPSAFLSARAIARRASFNIPCDSTDLPVNAEYVNQISDLGIKIHCRSKWLNAVTVLVPDSSVMSQVRNLSVVKKVQYTGKTTAASFVRSKMKLESEDLGYGNAAAQINQIKVNYLHNMGYTGKGIWVGVLDAGFNNVDKNPGFDSLRFSGRLLGVKDFAESNSNVYALDTHGANVLSIMTGNLVGTNTYLGSAPHASFWLIRTEYAPTEYVVETDFWVSGIEFADSVGVDVVNSSLGYTTFDDPSMNFTYADMNGKVSRASVAAAMAAKKGIIVCNSAGNDGNKTWHYIGSPADADGIMSVGAVFASGSASEFSAFGPTADNRTKPEVAAVGSSTAYVNTAGVNSAGNGTSYSSPVIAGSMACFLQYAKANIGNLTIPEILNSVFKSGNSYINPTLQLGYGIPDFQLATNLLTLASLSKNTTAENFKAFYNDRTKAIQLEICNNIVGQYNVSVYSLSGNLILSQNINASQQNISFENAASGMYIVKLKADNFIESQKIIVQ